MKRLTAEQKETITKLYQEGKNDTEISEITGICRGTICYFRKSHKMPTKFEYPTKIKKEEFELLYNQGLTDAEIASKLGVTDDGVYAYRIRNNYETIDRSNKPYEITPIEEEILIGTLLGDSSIRLENKNPRFTCAHSLKQEGLIDELIKQLPSMNLKKYYVNPKEDKRTGKTYNSVWCSSNNNSALLKLYNVFYKEIKIIPLEIINNLSARSLAWMFMDDGWKNNGTYGLATNCFSKGELEIFCKTMLTKFNLQFDIEKNHSLRLRKKDANKFTNLIKDYIVDCCKYKLI